tara:strand:- start:50 stop:208 length:159 start_codon:yes stop_codon:yes gene_type:complete
METLEKYIKENFKSKVDFARAQDIAPQRVTEMINAKYIVVDNNVYSKRFNLK